MLFIRRILRFIFYRVFKRKLLKMEHWEDHFFFKLNANSIVIDLGANKGAFSKAMIDKYNCQVDAYEPTNKLQSVITAKIKSPKFKLHLKAVSNFNGSAMFTEYGGNHESNSIETNAKYLANNLDTSPHYTPKTYSVPCVDINNVVNKFKKVDLIKIDIEGSEFKVLPHISDANLDKIQQISVEYHLKKKDYFSTPISRDSLKKINQHLKQKGFKYVFRGPAPDYLYYKPKN